MSNRFRKMLEEHKLERKKQKEINSNKRRYELSDHKEKSANNRDRKLQGSKSSFKRFIASQGHNVHKLKAKDSTGRWAYYFIYVAQSRENKFLKALKSEETIDLEDFGRVVGSCYGEEPSDSLLKTLRDQYGFEV